MPGSQGGQSNSKAKQATTNRGQHWVWVFFGASRPLAQVWLARQMPCFDAVVSILVGVFNPLEKYESEGPIIPK